MNWIKYKVNPQHQDKLTSMQSKSLEIEINTPNVEKSWKYIFELDKICTNNIPKLLFHLSIVTESFNQISAADDSKIQRLLNKELQFFPKLVEILYENRLTDDIEFSSLLLSALKLISYACSTNANLFLHGESFLNALLGIITLCADLQDQQLTHNYFVQNELLKILHQICVSIASDRQILTELFGPLSKNDWYILFSLLVGYVHCDADISQRSYNKNITRHSLTSNKIQVSKNGESLGNKTQKSQFIAQKPQKNSQFSEYNNRHKTVGLRSQDLNQTSCDLGQRSRDDLLLLLSLISYNDYISTTIVEKENFCSVLAASLSGLYCSLPRSIAYPSDDWYKISDEDILNSADLSQIIVCLDFCVAVIQVSNPIVSTSFLEFIYNGFLLSVLGPALHQNSLTHSKAVPESFLLVCNQISIDEVIATTLYLEMLIQRISEPKLLNIFIKFIFEGKIDGTELIDLLINRIGHSHTRMCTSTICLFKTLIELNNENIMHKLIFRYLLPCNHIMLSQQRNLIETDIYCFNAEAFLQLIPSIDGVHQSLFGSSNIKLSNCKAAANSSKDNANVTSKYEFNKSNEISQKNKSFSQVDSNEKPNFLSSKNSTSSESSYLEYLISARKIIEFCADACQSWNRKYTISPHLTFQTNLISTPKKYRPQNTSRIKDNFEKLEDFVSWLEDSFFLDEDSEKDDSENSNILLSDIDSLYITCFSQLEDALDSDNDVPDANKTADDVSLSELEFENGILNRSGRIRKKSEEVQEMFEFFRPFPEDLQDDLDELTLGPFLTALLSRVECMKSNTLYVNILLTGVISRLACYPHTLLNSVLLSHSLVFQPCVKSLVQVLRTVKQNVEDYFKSISDPQSVIKQAKEYLNYRINQENAAHPKEQNAVLNNTYPIIQNQKRMSINVVEYIFGDRSKSNQVHYHNKTTPNHPPPRNPILIDNKELIKKKKVPTATLR